MDPSSAPAVAAALLQMLPNDGFLCIVHGRWDVRLGCETSLCRRLTAAHKVSGGVWTQRMEWEQQPGKWYSGWQTMPHLDKAWSIEKQWRGDPPATACPRGPPVLPAGPFQLPRAWVTRVSLKCSRYAGRDGWNAHRQMLGAGQHHRAAPAAEAGQARVLEGWQKYGGEQLGPDTKGDASCQTKKWRYQAGKHQTVTI